ncbi:FAD synthetase [Pseudalkalibacillus sp. A8]|uniref:FAD synthetase n=1 Tax=Pseudalkalibacillus sp. A8 TaxID=3382641 RepID=UPI0038B62AAB
MKVHLAKTPTLQGSVIAIGAFDGVHRGHQAVIRETVKQGRIYKFPSVVYTFDPPPRCYFQGAHMLTPIDEKLHRIAELEIDHIVVARFDESYITRSSASFIKELARLNPVEIIVGKDFRFGRNREGDTRLLSKYFQVRVIEPVCCSGGTVISSTRIRKLVSQGEIKESISLLGWSHVNS